MRDACVSVDYCKTFALLVVLLSFEMLEDKHCLGVGGFDRAVIWHILHCYFVLILAIHGAKNWNFTHIRYLCEL